jgi:gamma-glutamyltranspeptidase/glutathione hydrolase
VLADPRFADVPVDRLLGDCHVEWVAAEALRLLKAPHTTGNRGGVRPACPPPKGDTVAVVSADADGWAVCVIQSVFHSFGARILEPSTGIVCQNRGACFTLDERSPNVLAGGKRPAHTLMPVLVFRGGQLAGVAGTMGGRAQPQIHAQVLGRLAYEEVDVTSAIAAPRWVVGSLDAGGPSDTVFIERGASERCGAALAAAGFDQVILDDWDDDVGHAQYISVSPAGAFTPVSDPRADGSAGSL